MTCRSPQEISADERISSCTAALQSKNYSSFYANLAYGKRAEAYLEKGDFDAAILDITQVMKLYPSNLSVYSLRALAYLQKGDFERAIADYARVTDDPKSPPFFRYYRARGIAYLTAGSLPEALRDLNRSIELNPKDSRTALWLEVVARRSRLPSRLAETEAQLDMTKWPAPVVRLFLGNVTREQVLMAADDGDAKGRDSRICQANFFGGELAMQRGTREEAVRLLRLAAADCPNNLAERAAAKAELNAFGANL